MRTTSPALGALVLVAAACGRLSLRPEGDSAGPPLVEYVDASFAGGEPGSGWIEDGYSACAEAAG